MAQPPQQSLRSKVGSHRLIPVVHRSGSMGGYNCSVSSRRCTRRTGPTGNRLDRSQKSHYLNRLRWITARRMQTTGGRKDKKGCDGSARVVRGQGGHGHEHLVRAPRRWHLQSERVRRRHHPRHTQQRNAVRSPWWSLHAECDLAAAGDEGSLDAHGCVYLAARPVIVTPCSRREYQDHPACR